MAARWLLPLVVWAWSVLAPVQAAPALPDAARSLVQVVTPSGAGTGVVVGARGQVLVPWHVVRDHSHVVVMPSRAGGPDPGRAFAARVVGVNRSRDLALLQAGKGAGRLSPLVFVARTVRPGTLARVLAADAARWRQVPVRVVASHPAGSWHSGAGVVHSAAVVTARAGKALEFDGGLLLDDQGAPVGLVSRAAPGGLVTAIAAEDVLEFIRAAEARTR